jgi:CheY-like chemotaxis protein
MEQVLMNLAINARDAMPDGGRLTVETANVDLDANYARRHMVALQPGRYVMLSVTDTGIGMDAETRDHIFEPFFTTKDKDKGTGLGLATVYGIVKQSGGHIRVNSEPGGGATFKVYLPRTDEVPQAEHTVTQATVARGSETVLLVEDEEMLRVLVREDLESWGYRVLEASHGAEALRIAGRHDGAIHLMVTDVIMPDMNGPELARRIGVQRPDTKVLCFSGCTDDVLARLLDPEMPFLRKPFTPDVLVRTVRHVLDRRAETAAIKLL